MSTEWTFTERSAEGGTAVVVLTAEQAATIKALLTDTPDELQPTDQIVAHAKFWAADDSIPSVQALARAYLHAAERVRDYDRSFDLYHKASMDLMHAYKRAHPDVPANVWPDVGRVNAWAVEKLRARSPADDASPGPG